MQTIYNKEDITHEIELNEADGTAIIIGVAHDFRSYEDRSVFLSLGEGNHFINAEDSIRLGQILIEEGARSLERYDKGVVHELQFEGDNNNKLIIGGNNGEGLVNLSLGEEKHLVKDSNIIRIGLAFIDEGTKAFEKNMINHQLIHAYNKVKEWKNEGKISTVKLIKKDEKLENYGRGFNIYTVVPEWNDEPVEFYEDFSFETVIYWSPFDDEYKTQLEAWWNPIVVGYDREKAVEEFNKEVEDFKEEDYWKPTATGYDKE